MKKIFVRLTVAVMVVLVSGFFFTGSAFAAITGSAHDFSSQAWNSNGEMCVACHTPHNANVEVTDAPLWNHAVTEATFTVYSSDTLDSSVGQPDGSSKLCLSCHDGTVALDSFGGATGTTTIDGDYLFGADLSNDHPISFVYDPALDDGLKDPTTESSGLGGTVSEDLLRGSNNNMLECSSCHDPHGGNGETDAMLVKSNAGSELCLTCHDK